jgi:chaperonin GroEL (HSP60 family)
MEERDREIIRERISKLTQKFAVIRVGGRSAVEMSESKDRVIDALNASRNALAEGVVPGGGAALLHASKYIDAILKSDEEMDQDRRAGMMIVRNAARLPMKIIGDNAGVEGPVIVENVAEEVDFWMGYDAQKDKYIDMYEAGIIDPLRVVMQCIVDASSVAGLMITTEASVCDHTEKELLPKD